MGVGCRAQSVRPIPACAGLTPWTGRGRTCRTVHPRVRGAHSSRPGQTRVVISALCDFVGRRTGVPATLPRPPPRAQEERGPHPRTGSPATRRTRSRSPTGPPPGRPERRVRLSAVSGPRARPATGRTTLNHLSRDSPYRLPEYAVSVLPRARPARPPAPCTPTSPRSPGSPRPTSSRTSSTRAATPAPIGLGGVGRRLPRGECAVLRARLRNGLPAGGARPPGRPPPPAHPVRAHARAGRDHPAGGGLHGVLRRARHRRGPRPRPVRVRSRRGRPRVRRA
ncbi:hypothetical protein SAMN05421803_101903 [Nocardiopsis flavescens]|uniref:Uncharacterized protein n=1 Tax=Nocardiopsis flavescens TaxID=758803 RepID=A0A1M6D2Q8_9ACTN|nr:hypothetical protein SAMN05421803_101903 [Nocardiopsis flavescens]